jgi:diphthamide biosynthesis methyltransferase
MLYIIGLGLADEKDISVKGLEIVRRAERVYLEAYTAVLLVEKSQLVQADLHSTRHANHQTDVYLCSRNLIMVDL